MLSRPPVKADSPEILDRARAVVAQEITGLERLAETLDASIGEAAAVIAAGTGRLVVTGVGKSGHIAAKLAATFASTGTPSFYLHAAEAAHGDLGMITRGDVVLAISNSGHTRELHAVTDFCQANGIPVVAMTANPESRLGKQAQVVLRMPQVDEVCPNNLAPTTSALVTMSLGHVLAVLLMELRTFGQADFAQLHPGGRLGLLLSSIRRYLDEFGADVPAVAPTAKIQEIIATLANGRKGCVAVLDPEGRTLKGIITEGDLRRAYAPDMFEKTAMQIMSPHPATIGIDSLMRDAVQIMKERRIANIVVMDGDRPVDVLHMKDLMQRGFL
ncbi:MAG TPA: KpsF/GutQ family sugar-phosphate isomerase [Xanthobacteraceae bacterium]|nr:KpsF/GutQ family sugar-phosphate isomerase [Xanthobacteraceae bacterium]